MLRLVGLQGHYPQGLQHDRDVGARATRRHHHALDRDGRAAGRRNMQAVASRGQGPYWAEAVVAMVTEVVVVVVVAVVVQGRGGRASER